MEKIGKYQSTSHANEFQYRDEMIELIVDHVIEQDAAKDRNILEDLLRRGCRGFNNLTTEELEQKLEDYDLVDLI